MKFALLLIILYAIICVSISTTTINNEPQSEQSNENTLLESKLLEAVSSQNLIEIGKAIENGDDINISNVHGWTATMFAITTNNLEILQYLISHEADLNLQNDDGNTALMLAAAEADKESIQLLLENNADPTTTRTSDGYNAYDIAIRSKRLINAAIILEASVIYGMIHDIPGLVISSIRKGAYVNVRSSGGWNSLHYATVKGDITYIQELITLGADVNHVENDGWSPLHFAAYDGRDDIVQLLLTHGGEARIMTEAGLSALDIALAQGHSKVVEILEKRMVELDEGSKVEL